MSTDGRRESLFGVEAAVEERLLQLACRGNERAWEQLIHRLSPRPLRLLERILASDADRASGILQDAWLIASGRIQSFESVDHLGRWMTCVCRRRAISILRHERGTKLVAWADEPSEVGFVASPPSPVIQSADIEAAGDIQAAIERLPDTQRGAALLHFVHGRPLADVALLLGARISAVKMRLHRARQRLREELRQYAPP